ncbi:hypothetical protein PDIG_74740 [Penicillium digitatum PHI26]|uniref:Uncharacterized protein n=2 Tax=Penicillium digitatum TaxID=36651 RepID=K9FCU6_PEND2|nr:hypothetical protein PDIP_45210 [Penicillium digitatum Pd1]EKV07200.1 hypothetical protein PDIG_74740 [Penicillium digitatum PHI26]EKV14123.1 hypothetical protein PDIP_45210 [Penicillium digitatum Pd1]KAG0159716.1 hypothetical protein PDIDSM_7240 [Penicillium digitatum]
MNSLVSTLPGGESYFPSAEKTNDGAVLPSDEVSIPPPDQLPLDALGDIDVSKGESTAGDTDGADFQLTKKKVDERNLFRQEDMESQQSQKDKVAQPAAKSVEFGLEDSPETKFVTNVDTLERRIKSRMPLNWSQGEFYTIIPASRDRIRFSKARQESRMEFFPAKFIGYLQDAGSKLTTAKMVYTVESRHGTPRN